MKISNGLKENLVRIAILGIFLIPQIVSADGWDVGTAPTGLTSDKLGDVLENIIIGILGFISLLGILYLVYGGIRYVTSAGNDSDMEEAKTIIMYAIWGLFLTASAYAIVKTVVALAS